MKEIKCPRCNGQIVKDYEDGCCIQCGYRKRNMPTFLEPLPGTKKLMKDINEEGYLESLRKVAVGGKE